MQSTLNAPTVKHDDVFGDQFQLIFNQFVQSNSHREIAHLSYSLDNYKKMISLIQYNHYQNLIHAINHNFIIIITFLIDILNHDQLTHEAVLSTAPHWLPHISDPKTFETLVDEMAEASRIALLPLLLTQDLDKRARLTLLPLLLHKLDMNSPKSIEAIGSCLNLIPVDSVLNAQDEKVLKIHILWKLNQYIDSVEQGKRPGFRFFKERQTENRMINCELAKQLKAALESSDIKTVFSDVMAQRERIRQDRPHAPWFNWMGSNALKEIIELGQRFGKSC